MLCREAQRARRGASDQILVLGLRDRVAESVPQRLLELVPRLSLLRRELVELVDAPQGEHELLARDSESACGRVGRGSTTSSSRSSFPVASRCGLGTHGFATGVGSYEVPPRATYVATSATATTQETRNAAIFTR